MTVGLIAAVGIAGFLVARSSRRGEEWSSSKDRAAS
jgi:hypothetical protein